MTKEYNKSYYQNNKEKWYLYNQDREKHNRLAIESYHRNKDELKIRKARWVEVNFEYSMWQQARTRAKRLNMDFNIERSDIIIPERCPYLDVPLTTTQGQGKMWTNASLDRIDSNKGYIKGNIQVISNLANTMKNAATIEQLLTFSRNVLKQHA